VRRIGILLVVALVLAGCGGGSARRAATRKCPPDPRVARLTRDIDAMKRAARLPVGNRVQGNAALNRATDAFLLHLETSNLDFLVQNRLIDHAAAVLLGTCDQCFQALEAERPIPGIAHAHNGTPCRTS
jgi:hypothetical protein